jgi:phage/plasmid-associated DNA primase
MSWEEAKSKLEKARTPQEKRAAAVSLAKSIPEQHLDKYLVVMQNGAAHAIKLSELPEAMQDDETYGIVKKVVTGD